MYYTFKLKKLKYMFLKLITNSKAEIDLDYSWVQFLNCGTTNICVHPATGFMEVHPDMKFRHFKVDTKWGLPGCKTCLQLDMNPCCNAGKLTAVTENYCSWNGLNKPNSSFIVLHKLVLSVMEMLSVEDSVP